MKNLSLTTAFAAIVMTTTAASAVVVSGNVDFNTIVDADATLNTWTEQLVVTDGGSGQSATFDVTLTNASGEVFNKLDPNIRLGVGTGTDGFHVEAGEDVTITVSLVSQTGGVHATGFNIDTLGVRGTGTPSLSWTSSVSTTPVVHTALTGETDRAMDNASVFHSLNSGDYSGTNALTAGFYQFSDTGAANGIGFNVELDLKETIHTAAKSGSAQAVSGTDLLQTAFGSVTALNLESNGAEPIVRNGVFDTATGANDRATAGAGRFIEYALDLTGAPKGYDLHSIETFGHWVAGSGGRSSQAYEVQVSFVDSPTTFFTLIDGADWTAGILPTDGLFTHVTHEEAHGGLLVNDALTVKANGVARVRFNFLNAAPLNVNMYREIDIFGTATIPTPAALPAGLAMLGLVAMRRRRK